MKNFLTVVFLWLLTLNVIAQSTVFHRVSIDVSQENIELLKSTGMVSLIYAHQGEYIAELSEDDLKLLDAAKVDYTFKIRDISNFYERQNRGKNPDLITAGFKGREDFDVPENFTLGSMGGFCTLQEINAHMDNMYNQFPDLISEKEALPTSSDLGNPIYWVKISDNPGVDEEEPEIFYNSLIHAREPASAQQLLYFMYHLLENYDTDPELNRIIDNTELYFILCINPDGYLYNEQQYPEGGGMWRKNRSLNSNGSFGIDPNRNFEYMWGYDDIGSSPVPNSSTYRGENAWSAPEILAVREFAESRDFKLVLNYHSFGKLLLHPWGYVSYYIPDDYDQISEMASMLTENNTFDYGTPARWLYLVNGDATDWFYGDEEDKPRAFAFTAEVGGPEHGFWPPMEEIIPQCQSCLEMNILAAKLTGPFTKFVDAGPLNIEKTEGFLFFDLKRIGFSTTPVDVSFFPLNDVFDSLGNVGMVTTVPVDSMREDSVFYRLKNGLRPGDEIRYVVKIENDAFLTTDTVTKVFGPELPVLEDDFDDLIHWQTDEWAYRDNYFTSPQFSASNVEGSYYGNNVQSFMYLNDTITISDADHVWVNFKARWDLDGGRDYIKFVYSDNYGQIWNVLQGRYSSRQLSDSGVMYVYKGQAEEWLNEWVLMDDIKDKPLRFGFQFASDEKYGRSGFYCDDFRVITVDMQKANQSITLGPGWTGISSFILPDSASVETILEDHMEEIDFLMDNVRFFQPGNNNNTLHTWNTNDGYMIKTLQPITLVLSGYPEQSRRLSLQSGWNLVSIVSEQPVPVSSLVTNPLNRIDVIKEACGSLTSWPEQDIQSLQILQPGSSYFIKTNGDAILILK